MGKPSTRDIVKQGHRDARMERVAGYNDGRKAVLRELIEHFNAYRLGKVTWYFKDIVDELKDWLEEEESP